MKRTNKTNRMVAFLAAVILTVFGLCQAAFAADTNTGNNANIDAERPVSLTISLVKEDGGIDVDKVATILIYQAGVWDSSQGMYVLTDDFAASEAKLGGETSDDILEEIRILRAYANEHGIFPIAEGRTQNGQYTSPDLSMGLYMVCSPEDKQALANQDNTVITPFLTTLPLWISGENETGTWTYTVQASPKHGTPVDPDDDGQDNNGNTGNTGNTGNNSSGTSGGSSGGSGGGGRQDVNSAFPGDGSTPTALIDEEGTPLDGLNPPASEMIDDEDVPLGNGPFQQLIEDVLVPLGLLPKTGDGSISYAPLLALMGASALLILGLIWRRRKKVA